MVAHGVHLHWLPQTDRTRQCTHAQTDKQTRMHACVRACTHTHTHTHSHTRTAENWQSCRGILKFFLPIMLNSVPANISAPLKVTPFYSFIIEVYGNIIGTFCKTKIAIFVKARGRGAKKMAHVREYPHESSCGRPSSRTNFSFRDRTFVRWIQWFSWFRTVVRLVLSVQLDFASIFFPSRFGLRWCSVVQRLDFGEWHAGWLFEPGAAVDGHRFSSNWQWTWFCVCGLEEQRTNSSSSMPPSSWESSRRREKCENLLPPNKNPPQRADPKQCKLRG